MTVIYAGLALLAGLCLAVQVGVNGKLCTRLGSPIPSALFSFGSGTLALAIYGLIARLVAGNNTPTLASGWTRAPWWVWTGGILGAGYIAVTITFAPRLGAAGWLGVVVAGQILTSIVLDHFGLIGFTPRPMSLPRLGGAILLLVGVVIVLRT